MKTTLQGRQAEVAVANLLEQHGFKVLAQNWRRPRCEIDLIVSRKKTIYFVEVKYRASAEQGQGFDYITSRKESQMRFAAEVWAQENNYNGDCRLMAAAVSGDDCENIEMLEL